MHCGFREDLLEYSQSTQSATESCSEMGQPGDQKPVAGACYAALTMNLAFYLCLARVVQPIQLLYAFRDVPDPPASAKWYDNGCDNGEIALRFINASGLLNEHALQLSNGHSEG